MEEESEVRMAALQQSTKDSERIIVESQAEKLRYMDEAHQAAKRVAHLEAKYVSLRPCVCPCICLCVCVWIISYPMFWARSMQIIVSIVILFIGI